MSYVTRTKDNPGDVGRAADQQQSVDNEEALAQAAWGLPGGSGAMARVFAKLTGIADNTATEFATITTTNEAGGADGGVYHCVFEGIVVHGSAPTGETSAMGIRTQFARAVNSTAALGVNSAVVSSSTTAVAASSAARTITTAVMTVAETSEYIQSLKITIDLAGASVTTGEIYGMITLYYAGFTTPPVITSIG